MNPDRLNEIISDTVGRGAMRQAVAAGFREVVERDWRGEAKAENEQYVQTIHGRRAPRTELERIEREILHEHEVNWRDDVEKALTLDGHSHNEEVATLRGYTHECEQPQAPDEAYAEATGDRTGESPVAVELLVQTTLRNIRGELAEVDAITARDIYKTAIARKPASPSAAAGVRALQDAIVIAEIERRDGRWKWDPKGEDATQQATASRELAELIRTTRARRVPRELREALQQAEEARQYAERMRHIHRLQVRSLDEVLGPVDPEKAEKAAKLVKGRRPGVGHASE